MYKRCMCIMSSNNILMKIFGSDSNIYICMIPVIWHLAYYYWSHSNLHYVDFFFS